MLIIIRPLNITYQSILLSIFKEFSSFVFVKSILATNHFIKVFVEDSISFYSMIFDLVLLTKFYLIIYRIRNLLVI